MKTRILAVACLLIAATSFGSFAAKESTENKNLRELVQKEIPYPEFARDLKLNGIVDINLIMDSDGVRLLIHGTEDRLVEYVKDRASAIEDELKETFMQNNKRHYRFTFRYIR